MELARKKKTAPITDKKANAPRKKPKTSSGADEQARYEEYIADLEADGDTGESDSDEEYGSGGGPPPLNTGPSR